RRKFLSLPSDLACVQRAYSRDAFAASMQSQPAKPSTRASASLAQIYTSPPVFNQADIPCLPQHLEQSRLESLGPSEIEGGAALKEASAAAFPFANVVPHREKACVKVRAIFKQS
ncbi:MAG: hypothetical protein SGPRY_012626, partial [Prymnesium sp.]